MRIMRRLLSVLSALSLMLLVAVMFLWGRSHFVCDMFTTQTRGVQQMWSSDDGRIRFGLYTITPDNGYEHTWKWNRNTAPGGHVPLAGPFWDHQRFGIGWDVRGSIALLGGGAGFNESAREWWICYWVLVLLTLPLSIIALRRIIQWTMFQWRVARQRRREGARGFPMDCPPLILL